MSDSRNILLQANELYINLIDLSREPAEKELYRQKQIALNSTQKEDEINLAELIELRNKLFHSQYMRGKNLLRQIKEFITTKQFDECISDFENQSRAAYSASNFTNHSILVQQLEIFLAEKINAREDQLQMQAIYEKKQAALLMARKKDQLEVQKKIATTSAVLIEKFEGLAVKQPEEKVQVSEIEIQRQKNTVIFSNAIRLSLELSTLLSNPQEKKTYSDLATRITTMRSNMQIDKKIDLKGLVAVATEWEPAINRLQNKINAIKEAAQNKSVPLPDKRPKPF